MIAMWQHPSIPQPQLYCRPSKLLCVLPLQALSSLQRQTAFLSARLPNQCPFSLFPCLHCADPYCSFTTAEPAPFQPPPLHPAAASSRGASVSAGVAGVEPASSLVKEGAFRSAKHRCWALRCAVQCCACRVQEQWVHATSLAPHQAPLRPGPRPSPTLVLVPPRLPRA